MKVSRPRTFSRTSTKISRSAKRRTLQRVSGSPTWAAIASASGAFELPARIFILPCIRRLRTRRNAAGHSSAAEQEQYDAPMTHPPLPTQVPDRLRTPGNRPETSKLGAPHLLTRCRERERGLQLPHWIAV